MSVTQEGEFQLIGPKTVEPPAPDVRSLLVAYILSTHQSGPEIIFRDPIVSRIAPVRADLAAGLALTKDGDETMKLMVAACHQLADDVVVAASGITQLVVLDAGLSTICYRRPYPGVRLYEVDLVETQRWKRQSLALAGVGVPPSLNYVAIGSDHDLAAADFEGGGYDFGASTLVIWLDGTTFLPEEAFAETLGWLGKHHNRLEVLISYLGPPDAALSRTRNVILPVLQSMRHADDVNLSSFDPVYVREALCSLGFDTVENIRGSELLARYCRSGLTDPLGGYIAHAIRYPAR